jgi:hypothetical protein
MHSTAFLLHSAGDQAVLVGESVGDTMQHWGEDNLLRLPNSEIEIKFSAGSHQTPSESVTDIDAKDPC